MQVPVPRVRHAAEPSSSSGSPFSGILLAGPGTAFAAGFAAAKGVPGSEGMSLDCLLEFVPVCASQFSSDSLQPDLQFGI